MTAWSRRRRAVRKDTNESSLRWSTSKRPSPLDVWASADLVRRAVYRPPARTGRPADLVRKSCIQLHSCHHHRHRRSRMANGADAAAWEGQLTTQTSIAIGLPDRVEGPERGRNLCQLEGFVDFRQRFFRPLLPIPPSVFVHRISACSSPSDAGLSQAEANHLIIAPSNQHHLSP